MKTTAFLSLTALLSCALGCEVPELEASRKAAPPAKQVAAAEKPNLFGKEDWYLPDGRVDMSGVPDEPPMTTSTPREVTHKDPKHGKLTRRGGGVLGTSLKAIPFAKHKTTFDMIKYNLNIYDAAESHFPRSHEEFMEKFLPQYYPAALPLPELELGDEYIYDPEDHLLKIYRPEGSYLSDEETKQFVAEHREEFDNYVKELTRYLEESGDYPQTHDDFMKIVKTNQIPLPELEPGWRFVYHPEDRKLMIWRPK